MWLDERTEFADDVDVSAAAGTALIGDVIDMSVARDLGNGQPVYLCIRTGGTEIITGGSAGTIQFKLASDAAAAISTTTSTIHLITSEYVTDDSAANSPELNAGGTIYFGALPQEGDPYERYLGILAVTATTTTTAGTINAFLTIDANGWKSYADATN
jgi:hypothetical protein